MSCIRRRAPGTAAGAAAAVRQRAAAGALGRQRRIYAPGRSCGPALQGAAGDPGGHRVQGARRCVGYCHTSVRRDAMTMPAVLQSEYILEDRKSLEKSGMDVRRPEPLRPRRQSRPRQRCTARMAAAAALMALRRVRGLSR